MKVFVSSTVYDLVDIRSELEHLLRELSLTPVMSDQSLSDFSLKFEANSIETCLLNVDASDAVIVVLDQRYGPSLGGCGFEDISATHLEYRRAKDGKKPIYFYVRDRLEADSTVFRKNRGSADVKLSWVRPKDYELFDFLEEHRKLHADDSERNWYTVFSNSTDLKAAIRRQFEPMIKPAVLLDSLQENRFPLVLARLNSELTNVGGIESLEHRVVFRNVSQVPAFDFAVRWDIGDRTDDTVEIVAPGETFDSTLYSKVAIGPLKAQVDVRYRAAIGVLVRERYKMESFILDGIAPTKVSGMTLEQRTYHNAPRPKIEISDG